MCENSAGRVPVKHPGGAVSLPRQASFAEAKYLDNGKRRISAPGTSSAPAALSVRGNLQLLQAPHSPPVGRQRSSHACRRQLPALQSQLSGGGGTRAKALCRGRHAQGVETDELAPFWRQRSRQVFVAIDSPQLASVTEHGAAKTRLPVRHVPSKSKGRREAELDQRPRSHMFSRSSRTDHCGGREPEREISTPNSALPVRRSASYALCKETRAPRRQANGAHIVFSPGMLEYSGGSVPER